MLSHINDSDLPPEIELNDFLFSDTAQFMIAVSYLLLRRSRSRLAGSRSSINFKTTRPSNPVSPTVRSNTQPALLVDRNLIDSSQCSPLISSSRSRSSSSQDLRRQVLISQSGLDKVEGVKSLVSQSAHVCMNHSISIL